MKSKNLIIVIIAIVAILVLFPSVQSQVKGTLGKDLPSLSNLSSLSNLASDLLTSPTPVPQSNIRIRTETPADPGLFFLGGVIFLLLLAILGAPLKKE